MNVRQEKALARVRAAQARAAQRHSYEYDETRRQLIVREPDALMRKEAAHDLDQ